MGRQVQGSVRTGSVQGTQPVEREGAFHYMRGRMCYPRRGDWGAWADAE